LLVGVDTRIYTRKYTRMSINELGFPETDKDKESI